MRHHLSPPLRLLLPFLLLLALVVRVAAAALPLLLGICLVDGRVRNLKSDCDAPAASIKRITTSIESPFPC